MDNPKILDATKKQCVEYCIPYWLRNEQIKLAIKRIEGRIQKPTIEQEAALQNESIAVVNFGPSLNDTWEELKKFKYVMTCSGSHKFLVDKGFTAKDFTKWYHIDVDPRPHKAELIGQPQKDVEYLIASACHQAVFDLLEGYDVKLWHIFANDEESLRILPRGEWAVTGGCIHQLMNIETEDGLKTIKWVVDNQYRGKVLSLDENGNFVWSKVLNSIVTKNNNPRKKWVRLKISNSVSLPKLICTEDHRCAIVDDILRPDIYYKPAIEIKGKFSVRRPFISPKKLNNENALYNAEQISVLMGIMMGDGDVTKQGIFRTIHGHTQFEYLNLIQYILGGTISDHKSGFSKHLLKRLCCNINAQTKHLRKLFYPNGKKTIKNILKYLNEISLAFWYMDNGHLIVKGHPGRRPSAQFCTNSFNYEDHKLLINYFNEKWGIKASIKSYTRKGNLKAEHVIILSASGSEKLFKLINKYIPESMQYKLPAKFRIPFNYKFNNKNLDYSACFVSDVEYINEKKQKSSKLYDLEVEDTHNFIANRTVVHNCSVGLRTLTIARFLGFKNIHIFGMDGNESDKYGKHAGAHPMQPKGYSLTEYPIGSGKMWKTTPSMLEVARQTFHELNILKDVRATFYGEGLVQTMALDYVPSPIDCDFIAIAKPELISAEYKEQNKKLHETNLAYGTGGSRHAKLVIKLVDSLKKSLNNKTISVLDFGCGKGYLAKALDFPIYEYDPAIPYKDESPRPADLVICTNVLEHVEPDKLLFVLDELHRCTKQVGYFVISTTHAIKTLPDGRNTHLIVKGEEWWKEQIEKFFKIASIRKSSNELFIIVGPK